MMNKDHEYIDLIRGQA